MPSIPVYTLYQQVNDPIDQLTTTSATKRKMVLVSEDNVTLVIRGVDLDYHSGVIVDGRVTATEMRNAEGELILTTENFNFNAGTIDADTMIDFVNALTIRLLNNGVKMIGTNGGDNIMLRGGDDIILGRGGTDNIDGAGGADRLTGGAGQDNFIFSDGMGRDTITDFDAVSGPDTQDFIIAPFPGEAAIQKSGKHDTLINFGGGDKFLLLDVKPGQIDETDFGFN